MCSKERKNLQDIIRRLRPTQFCGMRRALGSPAIYVAAAGRARGHLCAPPSAAVSAEHPGDGLALSVTMCRLPGHPPRAGPQGLAAPALRLMVPRGLQPGAGARRAAPAPPLLTSSEAPPENHTARVSVGSSRSLKLESPLLPHQALGRSTPAPPWGEWEWQTFLKMATRPPAGDRPSPPRTGLERPI